MLMAVGGFFRARLSFPSEYPHLPPKMKFDPAIFHPNGMIQKPETRNSLAMDLLSN